MGFLKNVSQVGSVLPAIANIYVYRDITRPQGRFMNAQNFKRLYQKILILYFENLRTFFLILYKGKMLTNRAKFKIKDFCQAPKV